MKKYFLLSALLTISFNISFANKKEIEVNKEKCTFEMEKGMLDGEYISYYPNGHIKSRGHFNKNNRVGKWEVYDMNGNVVIERDYKNSLQYIQTLPDHSNIQFNANNKYDLLSAESIYCQKRFFKVIDKNENQTLFENNDFSNYLIGLYNQNKTQVYEDDRLAYDKKDKTTLSKDVEFVSYKIKEDAVIDLRRFILDYRILAINPVVKINGVEQEIGWLYFPDLKESLLQENDADINATLSTLISRNYTSKSYKAVTMTSLTHNGDQYKVASKYESDYQDVSLIEKEHDVWLQYLLAKTED